MKNIKLLYIISAIIFLLAAGIGMYRYLNSDPSNNSNTAGRSTNVENGVSAEGTPPAKPSPSGN